MERDKDVEILKEELEWKDESELLKLVFTFVSVAAIDERARGKILSFSFGSSVSTAINEEMKAALGHLAVFVDDDSIRSFPYNVAMMFDTAVDASSIVHFCLAIARTISMFKSHWLWMRVTVIDTVESFHEKVAKLLEEDDEQ